MVRLGNGSYNSIKIGDYWVSIDYFGVLGATLSAFAESKHHTNADNGEYIKNIMIGAYRSTSRSVQQLPFISKVREFSDLADETKSFNTNITEMAKTTLASAIAQVYARTVPSIISDVAKSIDPYQRQIDYNNPFNLDGVKQNVPFLRTVLPPKVNIFGEEMEGQGFLQIIFGARVKVAEDSEIYKEMRRLEETGNLPTITDYTGTEWVKEYTRIIGGSYSPLGMQFKQRIGQRVKLGYDYVISLDSYQEMSNEDKKTTLNATRKAVLDQMKKELQEAGDIETPDKKQSVDKSEIVLPDGTEMKI
jgi:hypothetical protein